jgi:hypothetical protein
VGESEHDQDAHHVTAPNGNRFIAKSGVDAYEGRDGYTVEKVRGRDDENGRGFRVTGKGGDKR